MQQYRLARKISPTAARFPHQPFRATSLITLTIVILSESKDLPVCFAQHEKRLPSFVIFTKAAALGLNQGMGKDETSVPIGQQVGSWPETPV